jgi:hypothetical protein
MSKRAKLVEGPMSARMIEFSGRSYGEMFRAAADWFAANDGEIRWIQGVGVHTLDDRPHTPEVWYALCVYYSD